MKVKPNKSIKTTILDYVMWFLICLLISYVCVLIGFMIISHIEFSFQSLLFAMTHSTVLIGTVIMFGIIVAPFVKIMMFNLERSFVLQRLMGLRKGIEGNLENSRFATIDDLKKKGYRICNSKAELSTTEDGIILSMTEQKKNKKNDLRTIFSPELIHTLVLGTTGSGKTTSFIIPSIKALSMTATKPSFVITDPKGEIFENTALLLKEQGYDVQVLDFRHPELSAHWNPLADAFEKFQKAESITESTEFKDGKYFFQGKTYTADEIEEAELVAEQKLEDEAFEDIQNIVYALCPILSQSDPIWENGARAFIQAVILAMLEDSRDAECNLTLQQFCFYNVAKICNTTDNDNVSLKEYFNYRSKTSTAVQFANMVLNAPDKQAGSYLSTVAEKLLVFNDRGVANMTSGENEIDLKNIDERPSAVFVILADEKEGRHALGSLFLSQAYRTFVQKAMDNGGTLKRHVYFFMDEFGNLPKIDGVSSMFTVGRSRGIFQVPVIQSYSQLTQRYGVTVAKTVLGNCNIEVFIGSKDDETCDIFSKKLGNYTVLSSSVSTQALKDHTSSNETLKERPLMYPRELTLLNNKKDMGNAVIVNQGYLPMLGKFTPCFQSTVFENKKTDKTDMTPRPFKEKEILYKFTERAERIKQFEKEMARTTEDEPKAPPKKTQEKKQETLEDIINQLQNMATPLKLEFLPNNVEDNKAVIEKMIEQFRNDANIVKLTELLRLKEKYNKLLTEKKQKGANKEEQK